MRFLESGVAWPSHPEVSAESFHRQQCRSQESHPYNSFWKYIFYACKELLKISDAASPHYWVRFAWDRQHFYCAIILDPNEINDAIKGYRR